MEDRHNDLWTFRDERELGVDASRPEHDFVDFEVHAVDGEVGKVDDATYDAGSGMIVVYTGWLDLQRVVIPAGVVERVDPEERRVYVHCTKDQVRDAPEIPLDVFQAEHGPERLAEYYGPGGRGWRPWEESAA